MSNSQALLIVFGDIQTDAKTIPGNLVYEYLTSRSVWFVARWPKAASRGMNILFYQNGVGFRGTAVVESIAARQSADQKEYGLIPLSHYPYKVALRKTVTFQTPRDPRPLLDLISFITNKTYWGHSFRYSPRLIPISDYNLIVGDRRHQPRFQ